MNINLIDFFKLFGSNVQFNVPKWQRRYSWDKTAIEQLVKDLHAIAQKNINDAMHFGGTLITYAENSAPGTPQIYIVVDGQQRLTTISLLLICIAEKLQETDDQCGELTSEKIHNVLLTNTLDSSEKIKLQDGDHEQYLQILKGNPKPNGKVTAAWKVLQKAVDDVGPKPLIEGLRRFKVISFPCNSSHDPQQIFESLNATGVMLTEGEKAKNWLLMGLDKDMQQKVYEECWCRLETYLDAVSVPKRIDHFLRDFLRWKTGENVGVKHTYANLRRWWNQYGGNDRVNLSKYLTDMAYLYGKITGTNGDYLSNEINDLLVHLRLIGIDVHRPFTLRILSDAMNSDETGAHDREIINVLKSICTWLTRLMLAGTPTPGLNTQFTAFAHQNPLIKTCYADHWNEEIGKLRKTKIAVPNEDELKKGIRKRSAYGGSASQASKAVLWAINSQGNPASLQIEDLSLEYIMPQRLNKDWKEYIGADVEDIHSEFINSIANLTLVGRSYNASISNKLYPIKREYYLKSSVTITRKLAETYTEWRHEEMENRIDELTKLVTEYWPWENVDRTIVRWRINQNQWKNELKYRSMLLNVVTEILNINPDKNSRNLLGDVKRRDLFVKGAHEDSHSLSFRPIPSYPDYMINVHQGGLEIINLCKQMGQRCGVVIEVEKLS